MYDGRIIPSKRIKKLMKILKLVFLLGGFALVIMGVYNYFQPIAAIQGQTVPMIALGILVLLMSFLLKNRG